MYKSSEKQIMLSDDFFLPFGGKLNKENRWVRLANIIPWWEFEDKYVDNFKSSNTGRNGLELLNKHQYKNLLVIQELYRRQLKMYESRQYRIDDRIVSISQPHVRPIVRGKHLYQLNLVQSFQ